MKLVPVILSIIFAAGIIGYGAEASAQQSSTPCTASFPCAKICGDHPCAPGEVYVPGKTSASANATVSTNATVAPSATQLGIGANVTATVTKGMMANTTSMTQQPAMNHTMAIQNATIGMNATMTGGMQKGMTTNATATTTITAAVQPPAKQVASGTAPADVKCPSGYQLVLNKFDSRPACVSADVMAKLVARGWAQS